MKRKMNPFSYAISPGFLLVGELEARGIDRAKFAEDMNFRLKEVAALLEGEMPITPELAAKLESLLDISQQFWLNMENDYRASLREHENLQQEKAKRKQAGAIALRLPVYIHTRLVDAAEREGVSMNQLLLAFVAEGLAKTEMHGQMPK